ncbi:MAG TPA: hypothetical protein VKZ49_09645 [Polyangiaceae bacterium]|nr:hypothetical protein [Polyangiaceae bacterium]
MFRWSLLAFLLVGGATTAFAAVYVRLAPDNFRAPAPLRRAIAQVRPMQLVIRRPEVLKTVEVTAEEPEREPVRGQHREKALDSLSPCSEWLEVGRRAGVLRADEDDVRHVRRLCNAP